MRFTYRRYARENAVFAGKEGWTTPLGQSNRVLVGPFATGAEAQEFVNALREAGVDSLRWRSPDGQAIRRLYEEGRSPQPGPNARAPGSAPAAASAPSAPPAASHPARYWAQVAIGQNQDALRFTYRQFARRAPAAFAGKSGYFTPLNQTNRLLVGPFANRAAAQAFLDAAREEGEIEGLTFHSSAGQEVEPLAR